VLASGDWVTPTLVGGTSSLMVGQVITTQFGAVFNWPFGGALAFSAAVVMIGAVAASAALAWAVGGRRRGRAP
jgi:spermidine/putrescine transport system permease protein